MLRGRAELAVDILEAYNAYCGLMAMSETALISRLKSLAERLMGVALDVVGAAQVTLDKNWARNPKVVALTLLSRSLTNFRASMLLLSDAHVHTAEARALARSIYENLIWIGALRERGDEFVQEMLDDDAANKQALAELTLRISRGLGGDVNDAESLRLRELIKASAERFPGNRKLQVSKVARSTVIEIAYVDYSRLSLEAVHCSITALGRHLHSERIEERYELTVDVHPAPSAREILDTLRHLCGALLGVAITANELLEFTPESGRLAELSAELDEIIAKIVAKSEP
jgi:hypothetical protein